MPFHVGSLIDDFDRANETPCSQGGNWNTSGTNVFNVSRGSVESNTWSPEVTLDMECSFRAAETLDPDFSISCRVDARPQATANQFLLLMFATDAGANADGYALRITNFAGTFTWDLVRYDNATLTAGAEGGTVLDTVDFAFNDDEFIGLQKRSDSLEVYHSTDEATWTLKLGPVTDATYTGLSGRVTLGGKRTFVKLDALKGRSLPEAQRVKLPYLHVGP